jgi:hypothetical protein
MKKTLKIVGIIGLCLAMFLTFSLLFYFNSSNTTALGSTIDGQGYKYVTASSTTFTVATSTNRIVTGTGIFGSIIVASSTNTAITIWNATSTIDTGSTTIAVLPAGATAGTYTFDVSFSRGIILSASSTFAGWYVATYK